MHTYSQEIIWNIDEYGLFDHISSRQSYLSGQENRNNTRGTDLWKHNEGKNDGVAQDVNFGDR